MPKFSRLACRQCRQPVAHVERTSGGGLVFECLAWQSLVLVATEAALNDGLGCREARLQTATEDGAASTGAA